MILENDDLSGYGVDSSETALRWAVLNAKKYNLESKFKLILNSDPSLCNIGHESLDFIVANPPYIPSHEIEELMPDARITNSSRRSTAERKVLMFTVFCSQGCRNF